MESADALNYLKSINSALHALLEERRAKDPKRVATTAELDAQWGDPILKYMPRDWMGDVYAGASFSQCPPPLLDLVALQLDYSAEKAAREGKLTASGKSVSEFRRLDASRARGWAARLRAGYASGATTPPPPPQPPKPLEWPKWEAVTDDIKDTDIPF